MRRQLGVATVMVMCVALSVAAQDRAPRPEAEALARAWTAIAQGRASDAVAAADEALRRNPRSHDAISARIVALASARPVDALDTYDAWSARTSTDDIFLLEPIALGVLSEIAQGTDTALQFIALGHLAASGSRAAAARLQELRATNPAATAALARAGDPSAASSLVEAARTGKIRSETAVELLPAAGAAAAPALLQLLKDPSPSVRADAIRGLGKLGATNVVPQLRAALADSHPLVSGAAAVALTRLRDPEGEDRASRMLENEVPDIRLMAAAAFAERGEGPWVATVMPLLQDRNGLTRLTAAQLIAPIHPDAARTVLLAALKDDNPVMRMETLRVFEEPALASIAKSDLASLRGMLRDRDAAVRLHAASVIVELTRVKS